MIPTDYQRGVYAMFRQLLKEVDPDAQLTEIGAIPDNGDGRDDVIIYMGTMFTITIPPTGDQPLSLPMSAFRLREDIRAIMRAGGDVPEDIAERTWWPADLIREITEWHDNRRPDAERSAGMRFPASRERPYQPYHPDTEPAGRVLYHYTEADVKHAVLMWLSEEDENDDDPDLTNLDVCARFNRLVAAMTDWVEKNGPPHPDAYFLLAALDKTSLAVVD